MNDRETAVYDLARLGLTPSDVATVLRALPAIQRAHEAECCAWPEDVVSFYSKRGDSAFRRACAVLETVNVPGCAIPRVLRQRDPRGCTVALYRMQDDPGSAEPFLRLGVTGFTASQMERMDRLNSQREFKAVGF